LVRGIRGQAEIVRVLGGEGTGGWATEEKSGVVRQGNRHKADNLFPKRRKQVAHSCWMFRAVCC